MGTVNPERWSHLARPSVGGDRLLPRHEGGPRTPAFRRPLRARHDVLRWRPRYRDPARAPDLTGPTFACREVAAEMPRGPWPAANASCVGTRWTAAPAGSEAVERARRRHRATTAGPVCRDAKGDPALSGRVAPFVGVAPVGCSAVEIAGTGRSPPPTRSTPGVLRVVAVEASTAFSGRPRTSPTPAPGSPATGASRDHAACIRCRPACRRHQHRQADRPASTRRGDTSRTSQRRRGDRGTCASCDSPNPRGRRLRR